MCCLSERERELQRRLEGHGTVHRVTFQEVTAEAVKDAITSHPEWEAKLDRAAFSDANIAEAIKQSDALLGSEIAGGSHA